MTEVRMKAFVFGPAASLLINCTRSVVLHSCRMVRIKFKENTREKIICVLVLTREVFFPWICSSLAVSHEGFE